MIVGIFIVIGFLYLIGLIFDEFEEKEDPYKTAFKQRYKSCNSSYRTDAGSDILIKNYWGYRIFDEAKIENEWREKSLKYNDSIGPWNIDYMTLHEMNNDLKHWKDIEKKHNGIIKEKNRKTWLI